METEAKTIIQADRETVWKAMQKDLDDIKASLEGKAVKAA